MLGRQEAVSDKKKIYRWVSNFRQTGQTLEALKEAIRQEVAAITPEMILKVMDNYRERLHQFINIQGRHLSDDLFRTHCCKTVFCVLSRNRKTFAVSSLISNLFASQIGEFFLPHSVYGYLKLSILWLHILFNPVMRVDRALRRVTVPLCTVHDPHS